MEPRLHFVAFLLVAHLLSSAEGQCPRDCVCSESSTFVDCSGASLFQVPQPPFNKRTLKLDLSRNLIPLLRNETFEIRRLYSLDTLVIADNPSLTSIDVEAFRGLSRLKYLSLSGNNLAAIRSEVFSELLELKTLILDKNPLILPNDGFDIPTVISLSMFSCQLNYIPEHFFQKFVHIQKLNLSQNELPDFDSVLIKDLTELESFDISKNKLLHPRLVIEDLPLSVKELNWIGNEWVCDCDLKKIDPSHGKKFSEQEFMCSSPPELKKRVITDAIINEISCLETTTIIEVLKEEDEVQVDSREESGGKSAQIRMVDQDDDPGRRRGEMRQKSKSIETESMPEVKLPLTKDDKVILGAGVTSQTEDSDWLMRQMWWMIGAPVFVALLGVVIIVKFQVSRFARSESRRDDEWEPL